MAGNSKAYEAKGITVYFDGDVCEHSAVCVNNLPKVFDPKRRPWIDPTKAEADAIASVIDRCPSGALRYERPKDDHPQPDVERNPTEIHCTANGPLRIKGDFVLLDSAGKEVIRSDKLSLCRCGQSSKKPFCDGSHKAANFQAD